MAAAKLPAPGTKFGPCEGTCLHRDYTATRDQAGSTCRFCGEAIGYETRFYTDEGERPDLDGDHALGTIVDNISGQALVARST